MSAIRKPRQPSQSVLFGLVKDHLGTFLDDNPLPEFISRTFRGFLDCGNPEFGCFHLRCTGCQHDELVAFSCKLRGLCPSCAARASADSGHRLVTDVLPHVPFRHLVVSYPFEVGQKLAFQPSLISAVERLVHKIIRVWQAKRGDGKTGGMLFRHRFGSNLNSQMHTHLLLIDGGYRQQETGSLLFVPAAEITQAELDELAKLLWNRIARLLKRRGIIMTGQKPPKDGGDGSEQPQSGITSRFNGLHFFASSSIPANDRPGLEDLCSYLLRAPFDVHRLRKLPDGSYGYRLLRRGSDGIRELVMTANELLKRLATLIPTARIPTRRYFGILAGGSKCRAEVTPNPTHQKRASDDATARGEPRPAVQRAAPWAELMRRLWDIDVFQCPKCRSPMIVVRVTEPRRHFGMVRAPNVMAIGPPGSSAAA